MSTAAVVTTEDQFTQELLTTASNHLVVFFVLGEPQPPFTDTSIFDSITNSNDCKFMTVVGAECSNGIVGLFGIQEKLPIAVLMKNEEVLKVVPLEADLKGVTDAINQFK